MVWPFLSDKLRDVDWVADDLRLADRVLEAQANIAHSGPWPSTFAKRANISGKIAVSSPTASGA